MAGEKERMQRIEESCQQAVCLQMIAFHFPILFFWSQLTFVFNSSFIAYLTSIIMFDSSPYFWMELFSHPM